MKRNREKVRRMVNKFNSEQLVAESKRERERERERVKTWREREGQREKTRKGDEHWEGNRI